MKVTFSIIAINQREVIMKKLLTITLAIVILFSFAVTPVMAKKAGEVKDDVYTDGTYGFSFKIPAGWSHKISSSKKPDRIVLSQKSYPVPRAFQENRDFAQIPTITLLADTTSETAEGFFNKLMDSKFKSKQKDYFMKKLRLISRPHEVLKKMEVIVQKAKTVQLEARQQYTVEVPQRGSDRADVFSDFKAGGLFLTVRDGNVFAIQIMYEHQYYAQYNDLFFKTLLGSLKFKK